MHGVCFKYLEIVNEQRTQKLVNTKLKSVFNFDSAVANVYI